MPLGSSWLAASHINARPDAPCSGGVVAGAVDQLVYDPGGLVRQRLALAGGAGIVVLEEYERAKARGADIRMVYSAADALKVARATDAVSVQLTVTEVGGITAPPGGGPCTLTAGSLTLWAPSAAARAPPT